MKNDSLRELLDRVGKPRTDAAKSIGISRQYLYEIEKGNQEPTRPVIVAILAFLNSDDHLARLGRTEPIRFEELFGEVAA